MNHYSVIDSHCHLLYQENKEHIIQECKTLNIGMVSIGTKPEEWKPQQQLAQKFDNVMYANALHPEYAINDDVLDVQALKESLRHKDAVAVGETGIDTTYDAPISSQIQVFEQHVHLSHTLQLPLSIHTRQAEKEIIQILSKYMSTLQITGVLHCFTGSKEFAKAVLDLGFYISLSGIVTFKNAKDLQETVKALPMDRILVETDSPWLSPVPLRGQKNKPSYVTYVLQKLADLKNLSYDEVQATVLHNFTTLFKNSSL